MGKGKPKMPKFAGFGCVKGTLGPAIYTITLDIAPSEFGVKDGATNEEMVAGLLRGVRRNADTAATKARAEERAAVVAWLRTGVLPGSTVGQIADGIERGVHIEPNGGALMSEVPHG